MSSMDFTNRFLYDSIGNPSQDFNVRTLNNYNGTAVLSYAGTTSAAIKIQSTNKGFLPPLMPTTTKLAMSSPLAGLIVFDTTKTALNYYSGTAWVDLGLVANNTTPGLVSLAAQVMGAGTKSFPSAVAVGTTAVPAASAVLDVPSTTQGFLPPRMTSAQKNAIASPAAGLMVYDTDLSRPCFYNGSGWITI